MLPVCCSELLPCSQVICLLSSCSCTVFPYTESGVCLSIAGLRSSGCRASTMPTVLLQYGCATDTCLPKTVTFGSGMGCKGRQGPLRLLQSEPKVTKVTFPLYRACNHCARCFSFLLMLHLSQTIWIYTGGRNEGADGCAL